MLGSATSSARRLADDIKYADIPWAGDIIRLQRFQTDGGAIPLRILIGQMLTGLCITRED